MKIINDDFEVFIENGGWSFFDFDSSVSLKNYFYMWVKISVFV